MGAPHTLGLGYEPAGRGAPHTNQQVCSFTHEAAANLGGCLPPLGFGHGSADRDHHHADKQAFTFAHGQRTSDAHMHHAVLGKAEVLRICIGAVRSC